MKKLTERQQLAKQYVLKDFDFEKISKAMRLFDWKWGDKNVPYFPSASQLEETASDLIDRLFDGKYRETSTGGLVARLVNEGDKKLLELEFVLENGHGGRYL